ENSRKVQTRVDRIKTVVEQGAGIVKAMLGFSRDSDADFIPCELNLVLEDTIKLLGDRFVREVEISFEPTPDLPMVACPKNLIQQILLNFIFNAAEARTDRKQIILSAAVLERLPAKLVLAPLPAVGYVAVSVQDFGSGIAQEIMPRIFE